MIKKNITYRKLLLTALLTAVMISQAGCSWFNRQRYANFNTPTPIDQKNVLVVGILGGNERWDDSSRGIRQLTLKLRAMDSVELGPLFPYIVFLNT